MTGPSSETPDRRRVIAWAMARTAASSSWHATCATAPERARDARTKGNVFTALRTALAAGTGGCEAFPDGMAIRIDEFTVYEPDRVGALRSRRSRRRDRARQPGTWSTVLSPATRGIGPGAKLGAISGSISRRQ